MKKSKITLSVMLVAFVFYLANIIQCKSTSPTTDGNIKPDLESAITFLKEQNYTKNPEWFLFPGTDTSPGSDTLKRLGLPVHGRWIRTYVNRTAHDYLQSAVNPDTPQPLDFPPGSWIVKQNYRSNFDSLNTISPDRSTLGVITLLYKPDPKFNYCVTDHIEPYNGEDCLGGDWFYGFFFQSDMAEGTPSKLSSTIQANVNTFCVNCHAPGFTTDYVRTLDDIRNPFAQASDTPYCDRFFPSDTKSPGNGGPLKAEVNKYVYDFTLSPEMPADVPYNPTDVFEQTGTDLTQSMFNSYAWRSFIALNWPNKGPNPETGYPQRGEANTNLPFSANESEVSVWETFKPTFEVFQPGNIKWDPRDQPWNQKNPQLVGKDCDQEEHDFVITMGAKSRDVANETGQAFAGTFGYLVDQDSARVRYEVLFNRTEFEYLISDGRAATVNITPGGPKDELNKVNFPDNRDDEKYNQGAMEVKSAWKELCLTADCHQRDAENLAAAKKRFLVRKVLIYDADSQSCRIANMALIGLHIARKTYYSPQWIWITFEHKDNVPDAGAANPTGTFFNSKMDSLQPTDCFQYPFLAPKPNIQFCPNVDLNRFAPGLKNSPNQLTRMVPIDSVTNIVNDGFQKELRDIGSPFANYILVNTQWPLHGRNSNGEVNKLNCKDNGVGDDCFTMVPRFLRNSVIESYMSNYCNVDDGTKQFSNRSCMSCHGSAGADLSYVWLDAVSQRITLKDVDY